MPFVDQIRQYLPASEYSHLPMYSMSTETIETVAARRGRETSFLPLGPGVLYEFVEDGNEDLPSHILLPHQLIPGRRYAMVVSDAYGLRRYQTEDVFECAGIFSRLPDLRFLKRRNLSYSFTGEKLTADQLKLAYHNAESRFPELRQDGFLTCFPSKPSGQPIPCYRLVFVRTNEQARSKYGELASIVQENLSEFNLEFKSKIESRRLGPMCFEVIPIRAFVRRVLGNNHITAADSQFKFLPLYPKLWEALEQS